MTFEEILEVLHTHRYYLPQRLDEPTQKALIECIRETVRDEKRRDELYKLCIDLKPLRELILHHTGSHRWGSGDKGKIKPLDVEIYANQLIIALQSSKPAPTPKDGKKEKK